MDNNIIRIKAIQNALKPLDEEVYFIGGCPITTSKKLEEIRQEIRELVHPQEGILTKPAHTELVCFLQVIERVEPFNSILRHAFILAKHEPNGCSLLAF